MDFKELKKLFYRFWKTEDTKISLVRDVLVAFIAVFIILTALWAYTGQWFTAPMVAIESGSMMHLDESFGRVGTIDPGDMVLLVKVDKRSDIVPRGGDYSGAVAEQDENNYFYGEYGDVIVYRKYGSTEETQIIHRAMVWVDVYDNGSEKLYTIEDYNIHNATSIHIPELGIQSPGGGPVSPDWPHSGFITKGDNPDTNPTCDQLGGICKYPIKVEWITGKARGELPWIGTLNLLFNDITSGSFWNNDVPTTVTNVPGDCIFMLVIVIIALISIPVILDVRDYYKNKKKKGEKPRDLDIPFR